MINCRSFSVIISILFLTGCEPSVVVFPDQFQGYEIPIYFKKQILDKEDQISGLLSNNNKISSFIFLTDVHWEINTRHSPEIIRHIQNNTGIKNVFFGGDAINGCTDKDIALFRMAHFSDTFNRLISFYPVFGNHDANKITANLQDPSLWFSDEEVFSNLQGNLKLAPNVQYGDYFYYYVDDSIGKTRYLCLDTGKHSISFKEREFVADALLSTPNGWHIVIVTHIVYNATDLYDPSSLFIPDKIKPLMQISDAYNARGVYYDEEQTVYDFSNTNNRINLIIGGHIHRDYIGYTEGGIPLVAVDCDCLHTYSPIGNKKGTINEQCITVVITNYEEDVTHLIRFGRGVDITIQKKST